MRTTPPHIVKNLLIETASVNGAARNLHSSSERFFVTEEDDGNEDANLVKPRDADPVKPHGADPVKNTRCGSSKTTWCRSSKNHMCADPVKPHGADPVKTT